MEQGANNRMKRAQIHTQNSEQIHSKIYTLESCINYPKITANRIWEPDINLQLKQLKIWHILTSSTLLGLLHSLPPKVFGSTCYVHALDADRDKLVPRFIKSVFLGCAPVFLSTSSCHLLLFTFTAFRNQKVPKPWVFSCTKCHPFTTLIQALELIYNS